MATKKNNNKKSGASWKKERASVSRKGKAKPRSNKYSASDSTQPPETRERYWRAGYTRKDGTRVKGHYVKMPSLS